MITQTYNVKAVTANSNYMLQFSSHLHILVGRHCPLDEFQCNNTLCKPLGWKCDGEDDCGDNSDENPEECGENHCASHVDRISNSLLACCSVCSLKLLSFCPS